MHTLILLAHRRMHAPLVKLINREKRVFEAYRLLSTKETGAILERDTGLEVTSVFPAKKGGDIQLCGLICSNTISAVYFIRDPIKAAGDEPDIAPFYRACDLNNVALATNLVTAVAITHWLGRKLAEETA